MGSGQGQGRGVVWWWFGGGGAGAGGHKLCTCGTKHLPLHLLTLGHWYTPAVGRDSAPNKSKQLARGLRDVDTAIPRSSHAEDEPNLRGRRWARLKDAVPKSHGARPAFL